MEGIPSSHATILSLQRGIIERKDELLLQEVYTKRRSSF